MRTDISDFMEFHFYKTVKFYIADSCPPNIESFGKWLGPFKNAGSSLLYVILKANRETTDLLMVRCPTVEERTIKVEKEKMQAFHSKLEESLGKYQDDNSKLLRDGELPNNDEASE